MFIELTAYWPTSDPEEDESLGKDTEYTSGVLIVNSNHIVGYSPCNNGETVIRLSNGDVFTSSYKFKKFNELMLGLDMAQKMLITDEN